MMLGYRGLYGPHCITTHLEVLHHATCKVCFRTVSACQNWRYGRVQNESLGNHIAVFGISRTRSRVVRPDHIQNQPILDSLFQKLEAAIDQQSTANLAHVLASGPFSKVHQAASARSKTHSRNPGRIRSARGVERRSSQPAHGTSGRSKRRNMRRAGGALVAFAYTGHLRNILPHIRNTFGAAESLRWHWHHGPQTKKSSSAVVSTIVGSLPDDQASHGVQPRLRQTKTEATKNLELCLVSKNRLEKVSPDCRVGRIARTENRTAIVPSTSAHNDYVLRRSRSGNRPTHGRACGLCHHAETLHRSEADRRQVRGRRVARSVAVVTSETRESKEATGTVVVLLGKTEFTHLRLIIFVGFSGGAGVAVVSGNFDCPRAAVALIRYFRHGRFLFESSDFQVMTCTPAVSAECSLRSGLSRHLLCRCRAGRRDFNHQYQTGKEPVNAQIKNDVHQQYHRKHAPRILQGTDSFHRRYEKWPSGVSSRSVGTIPEHIFSQLATSLTRGRAAAARLAHNQQVVGSIPAPAIHLVAVSNGERTGGLPHKRPAFAAVAKLVDVAGHWIEARTYIAKSRAWLQVRVLPAALSPRFGNGHCQPSHFGDRGIFRFPKRGIRCEKSSTSSCLPSWRHNWFACISQA